MTIPKHVAPVAQRLGLSSAALPALYLALQGKGPYSAVQGLTPAIHDAVQNPWQEAFIAAASTVFLVSAAFSGSALILTFFMQNNDKATENFVASNVHGRATEKADAVEYNPDHENQKV